MIKYKRLSFSETRDDCGFPYCAKCGGRLIWQSDFMMSEYGYAEEDSEEDGVLHVLTCCDCGRTYETDEEYRILWYGKQ